MQEDMEKLLAQSASTDIKVLLTAKENAKRAVLEDPSPANLAALERASKLVEAAMQTNANFKDYKAVLAYAEENMRKVGKSKLFDDVKNGKLRRQADGSFKIRDVDRYLATLPYSGTPDPVYEKARERARRKEEADIRKAEAQAKREEFDLAVKMGQFVPKERVHLELAARAVTLSTSLKASLEARSLDIVASVDGNFKKAASLVELLEAILDEAFNDYSREMELTVEFMEQENDREHDNGAGN